MKTQILRLLTAHKAILAAAISISVAAALANEPTLDFSTVRSTYSYQGPETRDELVAVIAGSQLLCRESLSTATFFGGQDSDCGEVGMVDHGYYLDANFQVTSCDASLWTFRLGPDFGRGGAILVDGVKLASRTDDLWWVFDWNSSSVIYVNDVSLVPGDHRVEVFGFESCCAGLMSLEFQIGGSGWREVSVANLAPSDADKDGAPDCDDICPDSELGSSVVINGCDSQVPNAVLASGCTISDEIGKCAAESVNHGDFVSCVAQLTSLLKSQGKIVGAQKGAIDSCAAQSSVAK